MMIRILSTLSFSLLLICLATSCSGGNGRNGESENLKMTKRELPADIEKITPQFTKEDRATFVHPIRNDSNKIITLETNYGRMIAELYTDLAPAHADSFAARVADGFYNNTIFHRIVAGFMIQGGGQSVGGARKPVNYTIDAEFSDAKHYEGTLSMARTPDPNSASTQFFVCLNRGRGTSSLDKQYTVFGQLIRGYDTLEKLGAVECTVAGREKSKPVKEVVLEKAYLSDAEGNPL